MHQWCNLKTHPIVWPLRKWSCFDVAFHELKLPPIARPKQLVLRQTVAWLCENYGNPVHMHLRASNDAWFFKLSVHFFRANFGSRISPPGDLSPYIVRVVKWSRIDKEPSGWAFTDIMKAKYDVFMNLLVREPESQLTIKL